MNISETYDVIRILLGDLDSTIRRYPDATLAQGVRAMIALQCVPAIGLSDDNSEFVPAPDVNQFALLCLHTAKKFVAPRPDSYSQRTRAFGVSMKGMQRDLMFELEKDIHSLQGGTCFSGWQTLYLFLRGDEGTGLPAGMNPAFLESRFQ